MLTNLSQEEKEAGGFLTSADDVVQPYKLPKNLHEVLREPVATVKPVIQHRVGEEDDTIMNVQQPASEMILEVVDEGEGSQAVEAQEELEAAVPQANGPTNGIIMSMQQLAEAADRDREDDQGPADGAGGLPSPSSVPRTLTPTAAVAPSPLPARRNGRPGRGGPAAAKVTNGKAVSATPPWRGRKRAREGGATDSEVDAPVPEKPALSKRSRTEKPAPEPVVRSDRVLRSRRQKTAAQVQEEREEEEAYRRAVAE